MGLVGVRPDESSAVGDVAGPRSTPGGLGESGEPGRRPTSALRPVRAREGTEAVHREPIHGHAAPNLPSLPLPSLAPHSITAPARVRMALEKIQVSGLAYGDRRPRQG